MADKSRTAVVTGAAGGIGSAIVRQLIDDGYRVVATDSNQTALNALDTSSEQITTVTCDLTHTEQIQQLIDVCKANDVDTIVHSAGYGGPFLPIDEFDPHDWEKVFAINVGALFLLSRGLLPSFKDKSFGKIVAISSVQGLVGSPGSGAYVASKHALNGLIKTIAAEYGEAGITANAICPGYIESPMGADSNKVDAYMQKVLARTPSSTIGTAQQVARLAAFLASDDMPYMSGSIVTLDGGISADVGVL